MIEKMEVEKTQEAEVIAVNEERNEEEKEKRVKRGQKRSKWIIDDAKAIKQCEACGAEMHGWAYRQDFKYCPICGAWME